ncbi:hypothetical protein BV25DRAFT_629909 [Artomyces pyxidatus]|uniref:Uncharacterized protein n=1 Tax=Artomyces pyxidatus TaxID=48021 RepID=A0ACB8T230_9AGAM|nr:hypothetical protein BV25DRAFT_629909 [Artomyces pyxidatus]
MLTILQRQETRAPLHILCLVNCTQNIQLWARDIKRCHCSHSPPRRPEPKTAHSNPADEVEGSYTANKGDRTGHLPEILDLRPFLKRMEFEGRPVPTEESIEKMEITLKTKRRDGQSKFQLFDQESLSTFLSRAISSSSTRYYMY